MFLFTPFLKYILFSFWFLFIYLFRCCCVYVIFPPYLANFLCPNCVFSLNLLLFSWLVFVLSHISFLKIICSLRPFQMAYSRNYVNSVSLSKNNNGNEGNAKPHWGVRKALVPMPAPRWSKSYKWVNDIPTESIGILCVHSLQNFLMNKKQNASNGINSSSTYRNWYEKQISESKCLVSFKKMFFFYFFKWTGVWLRAHQENHYRPDLYPVHIRTKYPNRHHQYPNTILISHYERQVCCYVCKPSSLCFDYKLSLLFFWTFIFPFLRM